MSRISTRRLPLAGAALFLALGLAACGGSDATDKASATFGTAADVTADQAAPAPSQATEAAPEDTPAAPATDAAPAAPATTAAPKKSAPPTTAARTTTPSTPPTTAAAAPPTTAVTPRFAPGQRINPSSAQLQAAITTLSQRIPLFKPNESQLRTFADAACTSFDQGQTFPQVSSTIRQAVTYVQGASISSADADFAVRTVVSLRCPGYLP